MTTINVARLELLILARLAVRSKAPPTRQQVSKALRVIAARQLSEKEWAAVFERALGALREAGLVDAATKPRGRAAPPSRKRKTKAAGARTAKPARGSAGVAGLALTAAGRKRLQATFESKTPLEAGDWAELERKYLLPLLIPGMPGAGTKRPDASVVLLAQRLAVGVDGSATREHVLDSWLRASLGLPAGKKLTLDAVRAVLLARELGLPTRKSLTLEDVLRLAAVQLSGAPRGDENDVRNALTFRWLLDETPAEPAPAGKRSAPAVGTPVERIAAKALRAAEGPDVRQYGPDKVFIGSVWHALSGDPEIARLGEAGFKRQLAEAHRRGLVELSRADLVAAMDPREVAASETVQQNATYHFISRGASA